MSEFRVLPLGQEKEIQEILSHFSRSDIHYDPRYLKLFANYTKQAALYVHYKNDAGEILLPFFERALTTIDEEFGYKDLLSPWYYGGPIHTFPDLTQAQQAFKECLQNLDRYCLEHRVISQFQRLHPLLENYALYTEMPLPEFNRRIVSIDLTPDIGVIRSRYEYKARKNIARAARSGLTVVRSNAPEYVKEFIAVYTASMARKETGTFYYFNQEFWNELFGSFPHEAQLFTVYAGKNVAASSLVLGSGTILHDYLRGTYPQYLSMRPNDFVIDAIVSWAKDVGYREYSLQGGHAIAGDDSLFRFKKSFSPLTKDFYIYRRVHDKEAYTKRCIAEGKDPSSLQYETANPFPEYNTT